MTVSRTFFAWHRAGFATAVSGTPAAGRARAALPAQVALAGTTLVADVPVQLAGPGDVGGLDPAEIRRTEPYDGCPDFEPAYLPYVETVSPDLPWRFSPVGPVTASLADPEHPGTSYNQQRLRPWLALVVVAEDAVTVSPGGPTSLPVLTCDASALPDPAETWAWAHVQVTTSDGVHPTTVPDDPTQALARLVCPIRLAPGTAYRGFLVPAFRAGIAVGDGTDPLAPAWGTSGQVSLPVYYSYRFSTAGSGTFEELARRLRPRPAPASLGGVVVSADAPGWGVAGSTTPFTMQGALRPLAATGTDEPPADTGLAAQLATAVSSIGPGPQLRPPIYGQDYAHATTVVTAGTPGWLTELNTDPRRRLAAGLGTWAAAVEQDDLCDQAWTQLDEAQIPRSADQAALAGSVSEALATRHDLAAPPPPAAQVLTRLLRPGGAMSPRGFAAALASAATGGAPSPATPAAPRVVFSPTFDLAAYELLRAVAPEWLLPGAADIPDESVVLLRTNPRFAEAFLIGLNHALARELVWRRFPLDTTGTMVSRFWATAPGATDGAVPPISTWDPASGLGGHSPDADELVLLIRGTLLRRFPTASVYLSGIRSDGTERQLAPRLAGSYGPGTAVFGFPLTPAEALHPTQGTADSVRSWSVVLQEASTHTRLGADETDGPVPAGPPATWQDLSWGQEHLRGHDHVPVAGPLDGVTRPLWDAGQPVAARGATWGVDAGQLAAILQRPAFRVRIPVSLWLDSTPPA